MKQEDNNMITTWLKNNSDPQIEIKVLNEAIDKLIEQLQMAYLQADESAIGFLQWANENYDYYHGDGEYHNSSKNKWYKVEELLEIYKKEQGL
jgi:hypothetical protein